MLLNRGARILELGDDCTKKISDAELLYYGTNKRAPEGPHLLYKDGYYYLFEAEGGTGLMHQVTVSRSKTLKGVYEPCPYNPIMTQRDYDAPITCADTASQLRLKTANGIWYICATDCSTASMEFWAERHVSTRDLDRRRLAYR